MCDMLSMCSNAIKCYTVCSLDIYIILMSCQCYEMFDLALALVLVVTFGYRSLGLAHQGLGLELLSL